MEKISALTEFRTRDVRKAMRCGASCYRLRSTFYSDIKMFHNSIRVIIIFAYVSSMRAAI